MNQQINNDREAKLGQAARDPIHTTAMKRKTREEDKKRSRRVTSYKLTPNIWTEQRRGRTQPNKEEKGDSRGRQAKKYPKKYPRPRQRREIDGRKTRKKSRARRGGEGK